MASEPDVARVDAMLELEPSGEQTGVSTTVQRKPESDSGASASNADNPPGRWETASTEATGTPDPKTEQSGNSIPVLEREEASSATPNFPDIQAGGPEHAGVEAAETPEDEPGTLPFGDQDGAANVPALAAASAAQETGEGAGGRLAPEATSSPIPGFPDTQSGELDGREYRAGGAASPEIPNYEELLDGYSAAPAVKAGDLCQGRVVSFSPEGVIVDIGGKTEGIAPIDDFRNASGQIEVDPGDEIYVFVESVGAPGDYAVLSHRRARQWRIWERIERAYRQKEPLQAEVTERVKGGLTADVGVPAFLPGSQADIRPVHRLEALIGQRFPVRVVKISRRRGNVVVSRRELLEDEINRLKQRTLAQLSEGGVVTGRVKNVTNYGAFVDLGGIDGLVHVTDISYGRVKNPSEVLNPGDEITAKVLKFDAKRERVSLSLKHMQPDPWEGIENLYREGGHVTGRVASITDYGAFLELEAGVEGLIHITEMTWSRRLKHPSKVFKRDTQVEAVVLSVNREQRRISLSLKQLRPDPWTALSERYRVGSVVTGRICNVTSYGAFVETEEGIDGLVHISDLTWSSKVKHPKEMLKKGQPIQAVVLHIDTANRRLSLGIKQLQPDVWETFFSTHLVGDVVRGCVTRHAKFGAFVELVPGVEGLCHNSEMSTNNSHKRQKVPLQVGQEYDFKIIKLDEFDKRIGLSRRAIEKELAGDGRPAAASSAAGTGSSQQAVAHQENRAP